MNLAAPLETEYQRRLVDEGRRAFVAEHSANAAYRDKQPPAFRIEFARELLIGDECVDQYTVAHAGASLPAAWHRDAERRGHPIETGDARGSYRVLVPRAHYFRGRAPFAIDGGLVRRVTASLIGAALFASAAYGLAASA